jgi:phenylalanyl-tRNA synthetase beta chain
MRVPLSWLAAYVDLADISASVVADALTNAGIRVERVHEVGTDVTGVVVGEVLDVEELSGHRRPIRYVRVQAGGEERAVICGATNFAVGDRVALARPGATLPGGRQIESSRRYDRVSDGMICSPLELGIADDHTGILVLAPDSPLGADVAELLQLRDQVLELSINPDRGYALSVRGVAREAGTALHRTFHDPAAVTVAAAGPGGPDVTVVDVVGCDRYVARRIRGLALTGPSPTWLQRRLTLAGMRPISLAVDVTNHVMLDLGQPLHAFDAAALAGGIVVRRAEPGERLRTLDDVLRTLDPSDLLICDQSGPVAIAGVLGGGPTEVSAATTEIVLESAHFDPQSVARSARRHRLATEASRRFERGVDPDLAPAAAQTAADLLVTLGGASADPVVTDVDHRPDRPVIDLDLRLPGRLAGLDYPPEVVTARLVDVGCEVQSHDGQVAARPPSWRPDLRLPVDLVEEVVRLEGYERLPSTLPAAPAGRGLTDQQRLRRLVARTLVGAGYVEISSPPFVSAGSGDPLGLSADDPRRPSVAVANPLSEQHSMLRATLLTGLLATAHRNVGRGLADLSLFEIASVFRWPPVRPSMPSLAPDRRPTDEELMAMDAALPSQPVHLAVALTGQRVPAGWWAGSGRPASWADAVEAARTVARALQVSLLARPDAQPPWHPGRCAALLVSGEVVGHAGELHPRTVTALALPDRTCAMELSLDRLLAAVPDVVRVPAVSTFPPATLDVALVVAADVPAEDVAAALRDGAGPLLESLRLFDVYTGEQVGAGHKSLAYALRLRAPDRTLTVEEAVAVRDAAVTVASERTGAVLRGTPQGDGLSTVSQ